MLGPVRAVLQRPSTSNQASWDCCFHLDGSASMDAAHATGLDETQWSAPAPSSPLLCARKQRARPSATYVREPPSRAAPLSEADSRP